MIAEPPRDRYALVPVILFGAGLVLVLVRGTFRERRGAALGATLGLGVVGLAAAAALVGKDYVVERNLLPALIPLASAAAIGFGSERARRLGLLLALVLCAYWLGFDYHVTQTPNLQRPDLRGLTEQLGAPVARAGDSHLEAGGRTAPLVPRRPRRAHVRWSRTDSRSGHRQQATGDRAAR